MLKKIIVAFLAASFLAGCVSSGSNTLDINPKIQLPQRDPTLTPITISITGADQRPSQALAQVDRDGQIVTLTAQRDLRFLLQEALEKQMTARGYMVGANAQVNLQIVVNKLYADVTQGNLRYGITTNADISIIATAKNGNKQIKNYRQTYSVEGAFAATNDKIAKAVNQTLSDVITDMARDTSTQDFIKQNAR
ncbi:uncharacterized lipoprotein [Izhakiella capsodis]|uniref:Uncharacterized lipoprotein n=1 Tax=Izhakiella capsodis TaxID=1367852 RepID=A0A1I4YHP3_9GAMM|nr:lipoprotein [Izhakiella capsodis]SFN37099.1 uncharacterized lipoprotein [Izhakiella capsodis]